MQIFGIKRNSSDLFANPQYDLRSIAELSVCGAAATPSATHIEEDRYSNGRK
jgi:hypothetical protein